MLEALLDHLPDTMFFVKNLELRYTSVNTALLRRTGKRHKSEVLGRTAAEVFALPLGHNYTAQDAQVMAGGAEIAGQLEMYLRPGDLPGWCLTYKSALRGEDGAISGLCGISRDLPVPDERGQVYQRLTETLTLLQEEYGQPLQIRQLAARAGLSEDQFGRAVERLFGLTPKQLLIKTRLSAASELLRHSSLSISEIAAQCGYADHSAFTRQFRRIANTTPTQFRRMEVG